MAPPPWSKEIVSIDGPGLPTGDLPDVSLSVFLPSCCIVKPPLTIFVVLRKRRSVVLIT